MEETITSVPQTHVAVGGSAPQPARCRVGGRGPFTGHVQCMPLCNRQGLGEPPLTADSGVDLAGLWLHYSCYEYSLIYTHNMFPTRYVFGRLPCRASQTCWWSVIIIQGVRCLTSTPLPPPHTDTPTHTCTLTFLLSPYSLPSWLLSLENII